MNVLLAQFGEDKNEDIYMYIECGICTYSYL